MKWPIHAPVSLSLSLSLARSPPCRPLPLIAFVPSAVAVLLRCTRPHESTGVQESRGEKMRRVNSKQKAMNEVDAGWGREREREKFIDNQRKREEFIDSQLVTEDGKYNALSGNTASGHSRPSIWQWAMAPAIPVTHLQWQKSWCKRHAFRKTTQEVPTKNCRTPCTIQSLFLSLPLPHSAPVSLNHTH